MKKFKHIWIFSDSIAGHEIQSKALASKLSEHITLYHCTIRQPWLSFAPRILPRFGKNIIWEKQQPDASQQPDVIITCGRRMAAIGKYYKRQLNCKHIQILNPGDNPKKYDVLVCPEHDELWGKNIIATKGSLHNVSPDSLAKIKCQDSSDKQTITMLIGNPAEQFFKNLDKLSNKIKQSLPNHQIKVCGSRRTPSKYHSTIKMAFSNAQMVWLDESDGENPYLKLLACSDVLIVTADSINMLSEACATDKPVIVIGQEYISPKHQKFIESIFDRLSSFDNLKEANTPFNTLEEVSNKTFKQLIRK